MICGHQTDCEQLQKDIMVLSDWVKIWQMGCPRNKSKIMHIQKSCATAVSNSASGSIYPHTSEELQKRWNSGEKSRKDDQVYERSSLCGDTK